VENENGQTQVSKYIFDQTKKRLIAAPMEHFLAKHII